MAIYSVSLECVRFKLKNPLAKVNKGLSNIEKHFYACNRPVNSKHTHSGFKFKFFSPKALFQMESSFLSREKVSGDFRSAAAAEEEKGAFLISSAKNLRGGKTMKS